MEDIIGHWVGYKKKNIDIIKSYKIWKKLSPLGVYYEFTFEVKKQGK